MNIFRACLISLVFVVSAHAQDPSPRFDVKFTGGWTVFGDEGAIHHSALGGSLRYYFTRRWSVEPEILYLIGPGRDRDVTLIPHIAYDFTDNPQAKPYAIVGVGWLYHSDSVAGISFTGNEPTISGGFGVKIRLTDRVFLAPEFRLGFEALMRATASIGYSF